MEDNLVELVKVVHIELTTEDVGVDLGAELLDLLDFAISHVVLGRIVLGDEEHLVVLLPVGLEVRILNDDQVNHVEGGQDGTKIVESLLIDLLLKEARVELVVLVVIEQAIHLIEDVLG